MKDAGGELKARAVSGLHDVVMAELVRRAPPGTHVLDLGAGTGAFAQQLLQRGFRVSAMERALEDFGCQGVHCVGADLNQDFSRLAQGPFDVVTAIEVIEHLENPRHFLRQVRQLLRQGGLAFVTTPNIENVLSRLRFFVMGELRAFGRDQRYNDLTHITPIHTYMFEKALVDVGFSLEHHGFDRAHPSVYRRLAGPIVRLAGPLLRGVKGGNCHIFVLRAPNQA